MMSEKSLTVLSRHKVSILINELTIFCDRTYDFQDNTLSLIITTLLHAKAPLAKTKWWTLGTRMQQVNVSNASQIKRLEKVDF